MLALIVVLAAVVLTTSSGGGSPPASAVAGANMPAAAPPRHGPATGAPTTSPPRLPPIGQPEPGVARVFLRGRALPEIALTFDDGFCGSCVARIIKTLARTGAHATIFPNGRYASAWDPQARTIRRLVAQGQLVVGNHTYFHHDALLESPTTFASDLSSDELWIERLFHVSARPFFRPPYGAYGRSTLEVAGAQGFTKVIMWSGTVADSSPHTIGYILAAIRHWARPGAIILMHGNYPATSLALPQILTLLQERGLRPVTLRELLG